MTPEQERDHLMRNWEPKEAMYKRWGWTPKQIENYERHGDWNEANMQRRRPFLFHVLLLFVIGIAVVAMPDHFRRDYPVRYYAIITAMALDNFLGYLRGKGYL